MDYIFIGLLMLASAAGAVAVLMAYTKKLLRFAADRSEREAGYILQVDNLIRQRADLASRARALVDDGGGTVEVWGFLRLVAHLD